MGTLYEYDVNANELRHGGDVQGLLSGNYRSLDYLQGAGYGAIYLAGTPFVNMSVCLHFLNRYNPLG